MEFKSLKDLVRIVENSLAVQFYGLPEGQTTVLRKTVLKVLAAVLGGALYMLSLIEKKIWKNRFCSTCDASALDGFGVEYGMPHKAPMSACGYVSVILEDGASAVVIPKGTVLTDSSSSLEYEVAENTTIAAVSGNVFVKALENGAGTNLEEGVELEFRDDPIEGVESIFAIDVSGGVAEGVEIDGDVKVWGETAEEYRARLLKRIQNPVNGGSRDDYWRWATRFQFVTDAFVMPNQPNVNSVSVAIANYNSEFIYCSADQVTEVKNYMTDDVRRPITADVRVFSVTPVDVGILAKITPYNDSVKQSVQDAVNQYLRTVKPGSVVTFEQLELVVLSNSTAETFKIISADKSGDAVQNLSFDLTFPVTPGGSVTAEVAKCSFEFKDGSV
jgi:uncharacterized phage protein gp47/JayE